MTHSPIASRPLFIFCSVFFVSSLIFAHTEVISILLSVPVSALVLVLYAVFFVRLKKSLRSVIPILVCSSVILSGIFIYFTVSAGISNAALLDGARVTGDVTVLDVEYTSEHLSSYTVRFTDSDTEVPCKVSATVQDRSASRGDILSGTFILSSPLDEDKTEYFKNGIFLTAESEDVRYVGRNAKNSLGFLFKDANEKLCDILKGNKECGTLASAVLLGDRDGLGTAVKRDFSRLGIYHLLALSGLHLSVLVSALNGLLEKLRIKALPRNVLKISAILLYMALTGFSVSVIRAGIMHILAILAAIISRESDSFTSLSTAAVLILICSPTAVFDAGLILSVLAAYGCITMAALKRDKARPQRNVVVRFFRYAYDIFLLTLFINLITLPISWLIFREVSLISPVVNILFIPAVTFILILSAATVLLSTVPLLSDLSFAVLYFSENTVIKAASALSRLPYITVTLRHAGIGIFIILLFVSLIPMAFTGTRIRKYLTASAFVSVLGIVAVSIVGGIVWNGSCDLQYTFIGRSDAIIARDGNCYTVIDASEGTRSIAYAVTDAIKENKGCEIDTLILTHYDTGHISAVPYMADRVIIRKVLLPMPEGDEEIDVYERLADSLSSRYVPVSVYERDVTSNYSKGCLSVDFSPVRYCDSSSHPIVTLSLTLGGIRYAYGGRALSYADPMFTERVENADILVIGVHPPKGDGFFFPYVTGKVIISEKMLTDELKLKLSSASSVTTVKSKKVYSTGAYTPK